MPRMSPASMLAAGGAVPAVLCPAEEYAYLLAFLAELPPCAQSVGLECGLQTVGDVQATGIGVARDHAGAHALVPAPGNPRLLQLARRFPAWRPLIEFAVVWVCDLSTAVRRRVPFLFLEFDRAGEEWSTVPCTFVALDWPLAELDARFRQQAPLALPGFTSIVQILARLGTRPTSDQVRQLARCLQLLPAGGVWAHVGVLAGRAVGDPRMSLLVPARAVAAYLSAVSRTADDNGAALVLERYARTCHFGRGPQRVQVDFDVGEQTATRVGLSLLPGEPAGWHGLFAQLVADGLADERCAAAALDWQRASLEEHPPSGQRFLSHVKVVLQKGAAPSAKLYFGVAEPETRVRPQ